MLNNEKQTVQIVSFTSGVDAYGRKRQNGSASRNTEMYVKIYSQTNVSDIRYNDVEMIGLSADKSITTQEQVKIGTDYYEVLYIIPSRRMNTYMLKKSHQPKQIATNNQNA